MARGGARKGAGRKSSLSFAPTKRMQIQAEAKAEAVKEVADALDAMKLI